jgi:exopolyphosphatase / guanosine-5'-triphosphate,3'-diphosphate pyrophosphatase
MARFGAIDIGSNAMRLRVIEVDDQSLARSRGRRRARGSGSSGALPAATKTGGAVPALGVEIASQRASVRLGREVFLTGNLAPEAIDNAIAALAGFRALLDSAGVDSYRAVATSATREARNRDVLVSRAAAEAGIQIDVIDGVEEARLVQLAVRRALDLHDKRALLIDIGGGSTELTLLDHGEVRAAQSLKLGTVRLLEAFFNGDGAVDRWHRNLVREFLARSFETVGPEFRDAAPDIVVATGGNLESLAVLCPRTGPLGAGIDLKAAQTLLRQLLGMSKAERAATYRLRPDRADTIVPATWILLALCDAVTDHVLVPGTGLRDGLLEDLIDSHFREEIAEDDSLVRRSCVRIGRRYRFDERHGTHVASLACRLFDDLGRQHAHTLTPRDRTLLAAAATLHDVGEFIRNEAHHKHSQYIIEHSDIIGISPNERSVVANVARYHRKGFPDAAHPAFRDLSREDKNRVRSLSALLRVADALDREHLGKVADVTASVEDRMLRLHVSGSPDHELEDWTVARKAELFTAVFGLGVEVVDGRPAPPSDAPTP